MFKKSKHKNVTSLICASLESTEKNPTYYKQNETHRNILEVIKYNSVICEDKKKSVK